MTGSLFDIIGPVMVGPSSSHTAGAVRLGNLARQIAVRQILSVEFVLYNSFAKTYKGHGTDKGLLAGILGYAVDDDQIRDAAQLADQAGLTYQFTPSESVNHYSPNTVRFNLTIAQPAHQASRQTDKPPETMSIVGHSVGGGQVYVSKINQFNVSLKGELPTIILYYKDKPGMIWQVTKVLAEHEINIATLTCARQQKGGTAFMTITLDSLPASDDVAKIALLPDVYFSRCVDQLPQFSEV